MKVASGKNIPQFCYYYSYHICAIDTVIHLWSFLLIQSTIRNILLRTKLNPCKLNCEISVFVSPPDYN